MQHTNKPKLIIIVGPTSSGKTALAIALAKKYNGEVVSADSRQVYRGLDIGTGKVTKKEMRGVPHHLLNVANPKRPFSVAEYQTLAERAIKGIYARGKVPILCGGTGFYIDTVAEGTMLPEVPPDKKLRARLAKKSAEELLAILRTLDPVRAKTIEQKNPRRLIRAIEIGTALGHVPPRLPASTPPYDTLWIGMRPPEHTLRKNIGIRLRARMRQGMAGEARRLHARGLSFKRMEELGLEYRSLARFLRGKITKEEMLAELERAIWHYAKRQYTWWRRHTHIAWFDPKKDRTKIFARVGKFWSKGSF